MRIGWFLQRMKNSWSRKAILIFLMLIHICCCFFSSSSSSSFSSSSFFLFFSFSLSLSLSLSSLLLNVSINLGKPTLSGFLNSRTFGRENEKKTWIDINIYIMFYKLCSNSNKKKQLIRIEKGRKQIAYPAYIRMDIDIYVSTSIYQLIYWIDLDWIEVWALSFDLTTFTIVRLPCFMTYWSRRWRMRTWIRNEGEEARNVTLKSSSDQRRIDKRTVFRYSHRMFEMLRNFRRVLYFFWLWLPWYSIDYSDIQESRIGLKRI